MTEIRRDHQQQAVLVEDRLDHVADRDQLDRPSAPPRRRSRSRARSAARRDRDRDRDEHEAGGDLGEAHVDADGLTSHAPISSRGRALADRPAGVDPHQPLRHPPRLGEVVGDPDDDRDLEPLAQLEQRLLDRRRVVSASSAEVGSSSSSTRGSSASARASIARCCSPTESFEPRRGRRTTGVEAGEVEQPARRRARARRARRRSAGCRRPCPRAAPAAAAPGTTSRRSASGSRSRTSAPR